MRHLAPSNRSPPPPPPFSGRPMLPPTSPQYTQSQYGAPPPPPPPPPQSRVTVPPQSLARDPIMQPSGHRPGSSMSISSMLGADPEHSTRDTARPHSNGHLKGIPPLIRSPTRPNPQGSSVLGSLQRSSTPDTYKSWGSEHTRPSRAYSGGPPQRPFSGFHPGSPESFRFAPPNQSSPGQPAPYYQNTQYGQPQRNEPDVSRRRTSLDTLGTPISTRPQMMNHTPLDSDLVRESNNAPATPDSTITTEKQLLHQRPIESPEDRYSIRRISPERAHKYAHTSQSSKPAHSQQSQYGVRDGQSSAPTNSHYPFLSRQPPQSSPFDRRYPGSSDKAQRESTPGRSVSSRLDNSQSATAMYPTVRPTVITESQSVHQDSGRSLTPSMDAADRLQRRDSPLALTSRNALSTPTSDVIVHSVEDSNQNTKLLHFLAESKRGRISPLPQAVQGAQARMKGPTSEPGIKKEFGMMFSGIGSGVGSNMSTPVPPDTQTPDSIPSSPTRVGEVERITPLGTKADLTDAKKRRNPSKRRSRKARESDIKREELDLKASPSLQRSLSGMSGVSGRGQKRSRQSYQPTSTPIDQT